MESAGERNSPPHLKRWHYFSGLTLAVFVGFHLVNQLFALAGPAMHIGMMESFRKVYRHPVVETLLLCAVVSQIITGVGMLFKKRAQNIAQRVQIWSGMYLAYFLVAHVGAVLYGRYIGLDTNFNFAAAGLNYFPATVYFLPYYFLAVTAISLHISAIHYLKTRSFAVSALIAMAGLIGSAMIVLGYTDWFRWRDVPHAYADFISDFF